MALRILRGEPVPKRWDMGVTVIAPENVADWYDPSKPGESFDSLIHEWRGSNTSPPKERRSRVGRRSTRAASRAAY